MENLSRDVANAQLRNTTEQISEKKEEVANLTEANKTAEQKLEKDLERDKEITPPFITDTVKDGLTVFRFGIEKGIPLYFKFKTKEVENIMKGHFIPMSEIPRRPKNQNSKTLITEFNKLLETKRTETTHRDTLGKNIYNPYTIADTDFTEFFVLVMSTVTIETIISSLEQINLDSPVPTQTRITLPPPSKNDLDVVEAPQTNIMDKLQKAISRFNQFIQITPNNVKRPQYEAIVKDMWSKIFTLNSSRDKANNTQTNLIRTLLQMLLSVIQTWKNKHPGEPMTLPLKDSCEPIIPTKQWQDVTVNDKGIRSGLTPENITLIGEITTERSSCSLMGGRKSRKTRKPRKSRRTKRRPKRRTRRSRK